MVCVRAQVVGTRGNPGLVLIRHPAGIDESRMHFEPLVFQREYAVAGIQSPGKGEYDAFAHGFIPS